MPSRGLAPGARLVAAACIRVVCQRLAALSGFRREVAVWTWARQQCDTRVSRHARDSHQVANGPWCTGTAQATDADTTAWPHATHHEGDLHESLSHPRTGSGSDSDRRLG